MWPFVASSFRAAAFAVGVAILAKVGCMCPEQLLAVMIFDFEFGVPCFEGANLEDALALQLSWNSHLPGCVQLAKPGNSDIV
jgi:hypothetical protein